MYAIETPVLESVFIDLAPNAANIADIISEGMPLTDVYWYFTPQPYECLAMWAAEEVAR